MKRIFSFLLLAAAAAAQPAGYTQSGRFVIVHGQVPQDQSNFPVMVNGYGTTLKDVRDGGQFESPNGYDLLFSSDPGGSNLLCYERTKHDTFNGIGVWWVKVPLVSASVDTSIYVWWGNSAVTSDQSNPGCVYDSSYVAVWHLNDNSTTATVADSTTFQNTGANLAPTANRAVPGQLPNITALNYPQTNSSIDITTFASPVGGNFDFTVQPFSFEFWLNTTSHTAFESYFGNGQSNSPLKGYIFQDAGSANGAFLFSSFHGSGSSFSDSTAHTNGVWRHVAITRNGTQLIMYVNGQVLHTFNAFVSPSSSGLPFNLGGAGGNFIPFLKGSLQEFRVSNAARPASWIQTSYNNQVSPATFFSFTPVGWDLTSHLPPACNAGPQQSVRAGTSITLDGSGSAPRLVGGPLTYIWHQVPSTEPGVPLQTNLVWAGQTTVNPTITNFTGGPLNFQLTVTQSDGLSSSCIVHDGAVATDANGNVTIPNAAISQLIGPLTRLGDSSTTLPLLDSLHKAWADLMSSKQGMYVSPWFFHYSVQYPYWDTNVIQGNDSIDCHGATACVDCTHNSALCTAHGFNPQMAFCNGGNSWDGHSTPIIKYTYPRAGGGSIRGNYKTYHDNLAVTCTPTTFTLPDPFSPATEAGMPLAIAEMNGREEIYSWWGSGSSHANTFYESPVAYYSLYYRTGIDSYLNYGRWLIDNFWHAPELDMGNSDYGANVLIDLPHLWWSRGLWLRALDQDAVSGTPGSSLMWPGLQHLATQVFTGALSTTSTKVIGGPSNTDLRETAYEALPIALCALYDPSATNQANCATKLDAWITGIVTSNRKPEPDGKSAWWQSSTDCDVAPKTAAGEGWCNVANLNANVTITIANGGTTATINNGTFQLGWGIWDTSNTATFWRIDDPFNTATWDAKAYTITYNTANTATLSTPYVGNACASGCKFALNHTNNGKTVWGPQYIALMEGLFGNSLYFTHLALAANGHPTSDALAVQYLTEVANELLNWGYNSEYHAFGYCSKGLGNPTNPGGNGLVFPYCAGASYPHVFSCTQSKVQDRELPESYKTFSYSQMLNPDSTLATQFDDLLNHCFNKLLDGTYCSEFDIAGSFWNQGEEKYLGAFYGVGGAETWMSVRQGGLPAPAPQTIYVGVNLASVTNAAKVQVTPIDPSGVAQTPVVCNSSPCGISINPITGNWGIQISYLSGGNQVVAAGQPFVINVN